MSYEANYEKFFDEEAEFLTEVKRQASNSRYFTVSTNSLRPRAIPSPLEAEIFAKENELDFERTYDTAMSGTGLVIDADMLPMFNVSDIGMTTLMQAEGISGSSPSKMEPIQLEKLFELCSSVVKGQSIVLIREDMAMAFHGKNYEIMPIPALVQSLTSALIARFGEIRFINGMVRNDYTTARWAISGESAEKLIEQYQNITDAAGSRTAVNFTPVVELHSSDTSNSSATLIVGMMNPSSKTLITFCDPVAVRHEMSGEKAAMARFEEGCTEIFSKFDESFEKIKEMANFRISYPENTFIGFLNHLNKSGNVIAKKYAEPSRQKIEQIAAMVPYMSVHDIFVITTEISKTAREFGASRNIVSNIEEAIHKIVSLDWKSFDVGGTVAWK